MVKRIFPAEQLNLVFHALGDATRRSILERLAFKTLTIGELAEPYEMSLPAITKHVKLLVEAGLVSKRREGKFIRCQLETEKLSAANEWIEKQTAYWETQLDGFGKLLEQKKSENKLKRSNQRKNK